jgi:putative oxidoreductase
MVNLSEFNLNFAEFFLRFFLGILFIFQGYDKLFVLKIKHVVLTFQEDATRKGIPMYLITFVSYYTSVIEFFGGIALVLGFFHELAYLLLAFNLLIVAVAFSVMKPVWDLHHVFPRVILLTLIIILSKHFLFGLDTLFSLN